MLVIFIQLQLHVEQKIKKVRNSWLVREVVNFRDAKSVEN